VESSLVWSPEERQEEELRDQGQQEEREKRRHRSGSVVAMWSLASEVLLSGEPQLQLEERAVVGTEVVEVEECSVGKLVPLVSEEWRSRS
jgi:hypothetical protein